MLMQSVRRTTVYRAAAWRIARAGLAGVVVMVFATVARADALSAAFSTFATTSAIRVDHAVWDRFLEKYLKRSASGIHLVDYGAVSAGDREALKSYLAALAGTPVRKLRRRDAMAFWINLYNALTVEVVLDHYPVKSIRDIAISPGLFATGPWGRKFVTVSGKRLSLDDIEHRILRPVWRDARIHYVLNCAAIGCPDLAARAFRAGDLDAMLDQAARRYINHPRGVGFNGAGALTLSSLYKWYAGDFGGREQLFAHLSGYAKPGLKRRLAARPRISRYAYDWALNDAARAKGR